MSKIILAKNAGFCFGVDRAVKTVMKFVEQGKPVCTLYSIIHNRQMVEKLEGLGVRTVNSPQEVRQGETLVIRSHGVEREVLNQVEQLGVTVCDATCPFVSKIHKTVEKQSLAGDVILIA